MAKKADKFSSLSTLDRSVEGPIRPKARPASQTQAFGTPRRISHDASSFYARKLYESHKAQAQPSLAEQPLADEIKNRIFAKSSEQMSELPDRSVHLVVTSPPYNAAKAYDEDLSLEDYLNLLRRVLTESYRVLVEGGRACINVANLGRKPYLPLSAWITQLMLEIGFHMRGEIIWQKGAGAGVSMAWGSWCSPSNPVLRDTHEYILIFCKGSYGRSCTDSRSSSLSKENFMEWTKSVWSFSPASAKKEQHPAPFPAELPKRLIHLYTFEGDVILDPFMGSGTSAYVAQQLGRVFVGYEIDENYAQLARTKVQQLCT